MVLYAPLIFISVMTKALLYSVMTKEYVLLYGICMVVTSSIVNDSS